MAPRTRIGRRRVARGIALAALGLVVGGAATIAVAWRCAVWIDGLEPLRPIFPGFLLDTLLFGVAALLTGRLAGHLLGSARRLRRIRRGRCVGCGYPVGASRVCPECGAEVV